jgi:O-antigen/teichoic acid export membrane protein
MAPQQKRAPRSFATLVRWGLKASWALLDQGLFALSNLVLSVLLARWLGPADYGAFTVAFAIFLLLGTIHNALLSEPLMVFGPGAYREDIRAYLSALMRGHWLLTGGATLVLAVAGVLLDVLGQRAVARAVLALAVANPFILMLWLLRRACYVHVGPHVAAAGGLFYMAFITAGVTGLLTVGWMSPASALALMGAGSAVSALWIKSRLGVAAYSASTALDREVAGHHWQYGRWAIGTGLLSSAMASIYYLVLPASHGLASTAVLKAMMNVTMPALQAFPALAVAALPRLVRIRGTSAFVAMVGRLAVLYSAFALLYWCALSLWHEPIVRALYRGAYVEDSYLLLWLGLMPVQLAVICNLDCALRALERSDQIFRAYAIAFVFTVGVGLPSTLLWGPFGAIFGLLGTPAVITGLMLWSLRRLVGFGNTPASRWWPASIASSQASLNGRSAR